MAYLLSSQDLRTQLSRERDALRQTTLQKDIEVQDLRTKLDRSVQCNYFVFYPVVLISPQIENLSKAREALVEAATSRTHLQERVDNLTKQVQMSEEKLTVYERRGSVITATSTSGAAVTSSPVATNGSDPEELRAEIAELRSVNPQCLSPC